jgi:hypothetical protein
MAIYSPNGDIDANGAEEVNLRTSTGVELLGQQASAASLPVVIASNQAAIPVVQGNYPPILNGANYPQSPIVSILAGSIVNAYSVPIPTGVLWEITDWDGSGFGKAYYTLNLIDTSSVTSTLLDGCESLTNWVRAGQVAAIALNSIVKTQGTYSIQNSLDFGGKGTQTGTNTKTYSPALDLSVYDSILVDFHATTTNVLVSIRIATATNNYTFSPRLIPANAWSTQSFSLAEISFAITAVTSIQIIFTETSDLKVASICYVDNIRGGTSAIVIQIDSFMSNSGIPHQVIFPNPLPFIGTGTTSISISVTNTDSITAAFVVGFNGRVV